MRFRGGKIKSVKPPVVYFVSVPRHSAVLLLFPSKSSLWVSLHFYTNINTASLWNIVIPLQNTWFLLVLALFMDLHPLHHLLVHLYPKHLLLYLHLYLFNTFSFRTITSSMTSSSRGLRVLLVSNLILPVL